MTSNDQLYVLKLESDKYYVGVTQNLEQRLTQHSDGSGSAWTNLHKPIECVEKSVIVSCLDEDTKTKMLMMKYGISNVRGGTYTTVNLSETDIMVLLREFRTALKGCFVCGHPSHVSTHCESVTWKCYKCNETENDFKIVKCKTCGEDGGIILDKEPVVEAEMKGSSCEKCGLIGHNSDNCTMSQLSITPPDDKIKKAGCCYKCGRYGHFASKCYAKTTADKKPIGCCHRCGRNTHFASNCYAKTTLDGKMIA